MDSILYKIKDIDIRYILLAFIVILIIYLIKIMKSNSPKTIKEIGDRYEIKIGKIYIKKGYNVFYNGLLNGKSDLGVDLIAYKQNRDKNIDLILIQAKKYKREGLTTDKVFALYAKMISYRDNESYKDVEEINKYLKNLKKFSINIELVLAVPSIFSIKNSRNNYALICINKNDKRLIVKEI